MILSIRISRVTGRQLIGNLNTESFYLDGKWKTQKRRLMEKIITEQHQKNSSITLVTTGTINKLFLKLHTRYGNQWTSQWADNRIYELAINEWASEMRSFTVDDIKRGLDNYNGDFPPNLMQFKKACKPRPIGSPAPCYQSYGRKELPAPRSDKGTGCLKKIRSFLWQRKNA